MSELEQSLKRRIASLERDVPSSRWLPLPIGGRAAYYTEAPDTLSLVNAVKAAQGESLPYLVIGKGSHTLLHDDGFPGLVIRNTANQLAFTAEHSQVVADSGVELTQLVLQAANRGFGGLFQFFQPGTVGGALFFSGSEGLVQYVRNLTVLMPPTRIKPEATIVRSKGSWLLSRTDAGESRLAAMYRHHPDEPQPVILTAQLQLTSLREDEISRRLQTEVQAFQRREPPPASFGPLFAPLPDGSLPSLLAAAELHRIKHSTLFIRREFPNFVTVKPRLLRDTSFRISVSELESFLAQAWERIEAVSAVTPIPAFLVH